MNLFWLEIAVLVVFVILSSFYPSVWLMITAISSVIAVRWLKLLTLNQAD